MSLTVSGNSSNYEALPTGVYQGACKAIAAVGPVRSKTFGNISNKIYLCFTIERKDGTTTELWNGFTQSIGTKSNLGKILRSWRGRDFTPEELHKFQLVNILGVSGQIIVEQTESNGRLYANIKTVQPQEKGAKKVDAGETWTFDIEDPAHTNWDKLPKFIQNIIEANSDMSNTPVQDTPQNQKMEVNDPLFDSIPF